MSKLLDDLKRMTFTEFDEGIVIEDQLTGPNSDMGLYVLRVGDTVLHCPCDLKNHDPEYCKELQGMEWYDIDGCKGACYECWVRFYYALRGIDYECNMALIRELNDRLEDL